MDEIYGIKFGRSQIIFSICQFKFFLQSDYGKSYGSLNEEQLRKYIFLDNQKFVEQHNQQFKGGLIEFNLEVNRFGDMLHSEFIRLYTGYQGLRSTDDDSK
jgi:hypothetical protein